MTLLPKSATIGGTINLGNYDNYRFEISAEIASTEDYLGLVEFAASSLIGQFRQADPETRAAVRAYVARLCSIEEAQVPCMQPPAEPAKALLDPPPKQAPGKIWMGRDDSKVARLDEPTKTPAPTAAEQASAAVKAIIKPPTTPPKPEASDPYDLVICEGCGAETTRSQAKLSQLFMSKTLCKKCMDSPGGSA